MATFEYTITDELGIHARPAGELVKIAQEFESDIKIEKGDASGDLKRIFSIMALGTKQGETIKVTTDGDDGDDAASKIEAFLKENL